MFSLNFIVDFDEVTAPNVAPSYDRKFEKSFDNSGISRMLRTIL